MLIRLFAVCGLLLSSTAFAADLSRWPAFLGPIPDGLKADSLPTEWTPTSNVAWKAPLPGYGQSSVVTWEGTAYVTSISGENKEKCHLTAIAIDSGSVLWTHTFDAASQAKNTDYISKAAPSPVADGDGVVAFYESGDLIACNPKGEVRWQRNLITENGPIESRHGLASSLVQMGDRVFVWVERDGSPYVMAVEKATGKDIWKVDGLGATAWGSPVLLEIDGATQLILSASGMLAGYDPADGKQLWKLEGLSGNTVPTPQPAGKNRLIIGATSGRGESTSATGPAAKSNGLVEIKKAADGSYQADYVWRADNATSSFGSPIVHQGLVYFVNRVGVLFCLDLETGEEKYNTRIGGSVWATPLAIEDRIYFVGKDGETTIVRAGPDFKKIAENRLWEPVAAQPAAEGQRPDAPAAGGPVQYAVVALEGQLLIRSGDTVYCVRNRATN